MYIYINHNHKATSDFKFMKIIFLIALLNLCNFAQANIDQELAKIIRDGNLLPLERAEVHSRELIKLGSRLFMEPLLSGNKNMTCMHCHHPRLGTSDALPFSIGEGGVGIGTNREQRGVGLIIRRNSPALFNLGYKDEVTVMFQDGRVEYFPKTKSYRTPEPALNGKNPKAKEITKSLSGALSAQALFPILSPEEMLGRKDSSLSDNELVKLDSNLKVWQGVMKRLLTGKRQELYTGLFKSAYPNEKKYNIGHVGTALSAFMSGNFTFVDTPYDRYLKGDLNAMTLSQKKGLKVFAGRGQCINCHAGKHLSNFEFKTTGTPQIGVLGSNQIADKGRFEVTGVKRDLYKFKTPTLRNVALTGPYMHSGVFKTLREVINHYDNVKDTLYNFEMKDEIQMFYEDELIVDKDEKRNKFRFQLMSIGELRKGLNLTETEKKNLLDFLENALTDKRLQSKDYSIFERIWAEAPAQLIIQ